MLFNPPLQFQLMIPECATRGVDYTSQSNCETIVAFFAQALEKHFCFSDGKYLHRLYDKAMVFSCDIAAPDNLIAMTHFCRAARQAGYATKLVAPPLVFKLLLDMKEFDSTSVSEAWLLGKADSICIFEAVSKSLFSSGISIVLVERPDVVTRMPLLDDLEVSARTFRIIAPDALANFLPLSFCVNKEGSFSYPIVCPRTGLNITSIDDLFSHYRDAVAPAGALECAAEL